MAWIALGNRMIDGAELDARAQKVATGFESLGVGNGDGIAVYLRNDLPFFEASFGASAIGAYTIAVNWHCTPEEARYIFEDSGAKVVVIHADLLGHAVVIVHLMNAKQLADARFEVRLADLALSEPFPATAVDQAAAGCKSQPLPGLLQGFEQMLPDYGGKAEQEHRLLGMAGQKIVDQCQVE